MTPYLTGSGRWILATTGLFVVYGAATTSAAPLLAATALLAVLSGSYLAAVVRMWSIEGGAPSAEIVRTVGSELHRGETLAATLRVHNRGAVGMGRVRVVPVVTSGLDIDGAGLVGAIPAQAFVDVPVEIRADRAGRWTVHGLRATLDDAAGIVRIATYLPVEHHVKVWPALRGVARARLHAPRSHALAPTGANVAARPGRGVELRELRAYLPGDPLRRVDWKATARRRELTVRQLEDEVVLDLAIVIDASSTMRARARFEHALEVGHDLVQAAAARGDRVGVVSFDDTVYGRLPQGAGAPHYRRAAEHLLGLATVVDDDLTEPSHGDVVMAVVSYLLVHERLDFRRPGYRPDELDAYAPVSELVDVALLERWAADRVEREAGPLEAELAAAGLPVRQGDPIRRFARARGIEIPYRTESRLGRKVAGMAAGIEAAVRGLPTGGAAYVITDFGGVVAPHALEAPLRLAAARRTQVVFAIPFVPDYLDAPDDPLGSTVFDQLVSAEVADRATLEGVLESLGATVVHCGPDVSAAHLIAMARPRRR